MTVAQEHTPPAANKPLPLDRLGCLTLKSGGHGSRTDGVCLLEAVAWVAGEKHSAHPEGVCPVLGAFGRAFNDGLRSDEDRGRLLKPLIPKMVGTRATPQIEERRTFMAIDWLVRVHTPAWLDLREKGRPHAIALRALSPITDVAGLVAAQPLLDAARAEARADAEQAYAAWDAARDSAWDAARNAAAWDAAYPVAYAAAMAIFKPVVESLQQSAIDLFDRMIEVSK